MRYGEQLYLYLNCEKPDVETRERWRKSLESRPWAVPGSLHSNVSPVPSTSFVLGEGHIRYFLWLMLMVETCSEMAPMLTDDALRRLLEDRLTENANKIWGRQ